MKTKGKPNIPRSTSTETRFVARFMAILDGKFSTQHSLYKPTTPFNPQKDRKLGVLGDSISHRKVKRLFDLTEQLEKDWRRIKPDYANVTAGNREIKIALLQVHAWLTSEMMNQLLRSLYPNVNKGNKAVELRKGWVVVLTFNAERNQARLAGRLGIGIKPILAERMRGGGC